MENLNNKQNEWLDEKDFVTTEFNSRKSTRRDGK
jgi:hypothetical protein